MDVSRRPPQVVEEPEPSGERTDEKSAGMTDGRRDDRDKRADDTEGWYDVRTHGPIVARLCLNGNAVFVAGQVTPAEGRA